MIVLLLPRYTEKDLCHEYLRERSDMKKDLQIDYLCKK